MPRLLRVVVLVLLVLLISAVGYAAWRDPEHLVLNDEARAAAPGKTLKLSQGATHYEVAGDDTGRVVVLVHGFSVPSYIWDSTFMALRAAGARVIRYDLYGRGFSDRPDVAYDGAVYDRQLDDLLDSLHVRGPIDLVGLSFGGFVTAHYAGTHPERIRTLTLVDPVSRARPLPTILTLPIIGERVWQATTVPSMPDNQTSDFLHPQYWPRWSEQYRPQMQYKGFGRALLRSIVATSRTDFASLYAAAGRSGRPVLLVWGKQDQTVAIALSDIVRRNIPQVQFVPIDSSGHLPQMEQAATFNATLLAFLAAHPVVP